MGRLATSLTLRAPCAGRNTPTARARSAEALGSGAARIILPLIHSCNSTPIRRGPRAFVATAGDTGRLNERAGMTRFRLATWTTVGILGVTSSACLTDITWGDLPDSGPVSGGSSTGGSAGVSAPVAGAAGTRSDGDGAGGGAEALSLDGGVPDGGSPREGCVESAACLAASPFPLPAPCSGIPYSAPLTVTGGTPPLIWSLREPSAEFVLRPSASDDGVPLARIESSAPDAISRGSVVYVLVEDSSTPVQRIEIELDLTVRNSCWFAYISAGIAAGESADGGQAAQLHLRDVFLENDVIVGEAGPGALDFQFSPDGGWLAFRQRTPEGDRLYTYAARAPRSAARAIPLSCPGAPPGGADAGAAPRCDVLDYAWSADSNHLAFILGSDSADSVSGVSGFSEPGGPGEPWAPRATATWVSDDVPLDYREQLRWIGSDRIVFLGAELSSNSPTLTLAPYTAGVEPGRGVTSIEGVPPLLTPAGTTLLGGPDGALLIESADASESSVISFYSPGEPAMYHSGWLAPSGAFVGWTTEEAALELYDVHDDESLLASSDDGSAATGSCESIIAWSDPLGAPPRERIACTAGGALEFFEYDAASSRLSHLARVAGDVAPGARRAFSPDGRWFVFGSAGGVRFDLIDLSVPSPRLDLTPLLPFTAPVELLYPPTRGGLVNLADSASVIEYPLPGSASAPSGFASQGASPRSACVEAFWRAPAEWCGAPRAAQHLAYAPDSRSLLFEDAPGHLSIAQPGSDPRAHQVSAALGACSDSCPGRVFAFQP
jgi:hypothetical protein